jgi:cell division protein FtsX
MRGVEGGQYGSRGGPLYLLKLALRPWRIAPMSQFFSAVAVGSLLILFGFLNWMQEGLRPVLSRLQGEQVVTAYLNSAVNSNEEAKLVDTIRMSLGSQNSPAPEVKLMTAPHFIALVKSQYPDLGKELEDLGQDMNQVIPRYISVSGILPDAALSKIQSVPGIEYAESSKDRYHHVVGAFAALRWVVRILMGGVGIALFTGLIHLSRMNAYLHKDALTLLRFWGAGNVTLIGPGMISGLSVGFLGGLIALSGWLTAGSWLTHHVRSLSSMLKGMPIVHASLSIQLLLMGAVVGLLAGMLGSFSDAQLGKIPGGLGG